MSRRRTPDDRLVEAATRAGRARRIGSAVRTVRVEYESGEVVEVSATAGPATSPAGTEALRAAILAALAVAPTPLQGRTLARRCGVAYTGYFRGVLSGLRHDGILDLIRAEGYWPRGQPMPGDLFPAA